MSFEKANTHSSNVVESWNVETLVEAAKDLPIIEYELTNESYDKSLNWTLDNVSDFICHMKRVEDCDINVPIILRADGVVMDGRHRIVKAMALGLRVLPARQFVVDPEPYHRYHKPANVGYFTHLRLNMKVAFRAFGMSFFHVLHGLIPIRITEHDFWGLTYKKH